MTEGLSPASRSDAIAGMTADEVDVLVVGGGVVGAGAALDAVTRGLTTAIVEARDWANGPRAAAVPPAQLQGQPAVQFS